MPYEFFYVSKARWRFFFYVKYAKTKLSLNLPFENHGKRTSQELNLWETEDLCHTSSSIPLCRQEVTILTQLCKKNWFSQAYSQVSGDPSPQGYRLIPLTRDTPPRNTVKSEENTRNNDWNHEISQESTRFWTGGKNDIRGRREKMWRPKNTTVFSSILEPDRG